MTKQTRFNSYICSECGITFWGDVAVITYYSYGQTITRPQRFCGRGCAQTWLNANR